MKEFKVTIDRTLHQVRTFNIKAENEEQANAIAIDKTYGNEGWDWDGKEYETTYDISLEEVPNDYIDRNGNPYDSDDENACCPAGGGLHKDCDFNADALYAYYVVKDREEIFKYLSNKHFALEKYGRRAFEVWRKGNTKIIFEIYDESAGIWGYMHTELV